MNETKNEGFLREDSFDANWFDAIDKELANKVIQEGKQIRKFEDNGTTWWTLYTYENEQYIGLCDFTDMWLVDEEMSEKIEDFV